MSRIRYDKKATERFLKWCRDPDPWWKFWNRKNPIILMTLWGICAYHKRHDTLTFLNEGGIIELRIGANGSERVKALIGDGAAINKPHPEYDCVSYGPDYENNIAYDINGCFRLFRNKKDADNMALVTGMFCTLRGLESEMVVMPFNVCVPESVVCFDKKRKTIGATYIGLTQANYDSYLSHSGSKKEKDSND